MRITETQIPGLLVLEPERRDDHRGWFAETYSAGTLARHGLEAVFVQDSHSFTYREGTVRGLHFQNNPKAQTKLVRCTRGAVWDVAVDLRRGSPAYARWFAAALTAENKRQLWIPKGFAHGVLTLTDNCEVQYKLDELYAHESDRAIRWDDPQIGIKWPAAAPVLSEKDASAPLLKDSDANFVFGAEGGRQ